jgi:hypothetical protein
MSRTDVIATTGTVTKVPAPDLGKFVAAFQNGQLSQLPADQQTKFLIALGNHIGVRAELGELILYQGKPYITIDGRIRSAHASGMLVGLDARPATSLERRNFGAEEGDALWVCSAHRRGGARGFQGWGHVNPKTDRNPVAKQFPREMAKKRAKYDALRAAFPAGEEIGQMHQHFIEAAEEYASAQLAVAAPIQALMAGEYDAGAEEGGEEVAAVEIASDTGTGDPPAPSTPAPTKHATDEQIHRLVALVSEPHVSKETREKFESHLHRGMSQQRAATWIDALEKHPERKKAKA